VVDLRAIREGFVASTWLRGDDETAAHVCITYLGFNVASSVLGLIMEIL